MTRKNRKDTQPFQTTALEWLILSAPYVIGVYHPWAAALVSTALLLLLCRTVQTQGHLKLSRSPVLLAAAAIPLFLLGGLIWGTDRGMALVDAFGAKREVTAELLDDLEPGDFVMVHAGMAIAKVLQGEAEESEDILAREGLSLAKEGLS